MFFHQQSDLVFSTIAQGQRAQSQTEISSKEMQGIMPRRDVLLSATSETCWDAVAPGPFPKDNTLEEDM